MIKYLLYCATSKQISLSQLALARIGATLKTDPESHLPFYELSNKHIQPITLRVFHNEGIRGVSEHLKTNPVDLLVYDERNDGVEALEAISSIKKDVTRLAETWGPDFLFPMSRIVAILEEKPSTEHRIFELGRQNLRDAMVNPSSTISVLNWLKEILLIGSSSEQENVGMALSGGGVEGFLYQIGVLYALDRAISPQYSLRQGTKTISGVSSGSIAGSLFACKIPLEEIIRSINRQSERLPSLTSTTIFDIAGSDFLKRVVKEYTIWTGISPQKWIEKIMRSVPTGIFKGQALENFIADVLKAYDVKDSFKELNDCKLYIGATNQDSYEHVLFSSEMDEELKISEVIRASCALPPIFLPKKIGGKFYFDGQVTKTVAFEPLLQNSCKLAIIINPLKPLASQIVGEADDRGGIYVMIQTVKALISTRFETSLSHITEKYPDMDFIVFEPDEDCAKLMAGSPMKFRIRTKLIKLSYLNTLKRLRDRHKVYSNKFEKYGFKLADIDKLKSLEENEGSVFDEFK